MGSDAEDSAFDAEEWVRALCGCKGAEEAPLPLPNCDTAQFIRTTGEIANCLQNSLFFAALERALLCQEAVSLHAVEPIPPFRDWPATVVRTLSFVAWTI
ncbi:hypothetical protein CDAR_22171 [Caerostris darwini]|uniref:Uncharacterized protein n=1 Tax=Caerostris darwini TaxID=1538125 RepID=A0AAV4US87_9ARAC|nr:hypothetical protein CDAR_22171 [Caerostris darwini]